MYTAELRLLIEMFNTTTNYVTHRGSLEKDEIERLNAIIEYDLERVGTFFMTVFQQHFNGDLDAFINWVENEVKNDS